jgi:hypothetical protein
MNETPLSTIYLKAYDRLSAKHGKVDHDTFIAACSMFQTRSEVCNTHFGDNLFAVLIVKAYERIAARLKTLCPHGEPLTEPCARCRSLAAREEARK